MNSDMPRKYKPVAGPSGYQKYDEASMKNVVDEVLKGRLSERRAAEKWGVPKSTLGDHVRTTQSGFTVLKPGGQLVLSEEDEDILNQGLLVCAEWGYPLHASDVKDVVQSYLNREGRVVKCFKDNRQGEDWIWNYLRRHSNLMNRFAENIKRSRAAVDAPMVNRFFANLEHTLERGVLPEHFINFDETNFCDDPGSKRVIVRRGCRRPEKIMDHSKSSISVMMAATGNGNLLPPFTVHKSQYLYPTWVEGGLPNSRYGCSKSGWFDMFLFEEWFVTVLIEYFKTEM